MSLAVAGQAHALVAYSIGAINGADPGLGYNQANVVTFDDPTAPGVVETDGGLAGSVGLFTLTHVDLAAAPAGDTTQFQALQPQATVNFDFTTYAPGVSSLSVYVGSIDVYNRFVVSTVKGNTYFDGTDFLNHNGDQFSKQTNRRVYFLFAPDEIFQSITLGSNGIAFEYDTLAVEDYRGANAPLELPPEGPDVVPLIPTSVPEPTAWALLLSGFGLVGAAVRGRRIPLAG